MLVLLEVKAGKYNWMTITTEALDLLKIFQTKVIDLQSVLIRNTFLIIFKLALLIPRWHTS